MKNLIALIGTVTLVFLFSCVSDKQINSKNNKDELSPASECGMVIMAYYMPGKDYDPEQIPVSKMSHIIFSFTEVIDNKMAFRDQSSEEKLKELTAQKKRNPDLKIMIACGGWGGSGGFSDMAASEDNRKVFVESLIDFIDHYELDGLDIDWEYPGMAGAGNTFRAEDKENFTALMKELREAMDDSGKDLILTFAAAGWELFFDNIEAARVMNYADYMNIMTYDFVGGSSQYTGHHTNLGLITAKDLLGTAYMDYINEVVIKEREEEWQPRSTERIVNYCIDLGIDSRQIVIGAAFYGRSWQGVNPENNGLYQANSGVHTGWSAYSDIREKFENKNGYIAYWDEKAKAPYLYNKTDSIFISYDDTCSVKLKTRYAADNNLGGIMYWEQSLDTKEKNSLLNAIYKEAKTER